MRTISATSDVRRASVSPEVEALVPHVLIDYLWSLALDEAWARCEKQLFILQAGELGGRAVQDIAHVYDFAVPAEMHRVFGMEPLDEMLVVVRIADGHEMILYAE